MKAAQILLQEAIPEDVFDPEDTYDKASLSKLSARIADKHPEKYAKIIKRVQDIGLNNAYLQGESITLADMRPVFDKGAVYDLMDDELRKLRVSESNKDKVKVGELKIYEKYLDIITKKTNEGAMKTHNNLGYSVLSGARGKTDQLRAMVSTPGLYTNTKGEIIPLFIRNSYGEGLRPAEYLASTFGIRSAILAMKNSTAKAGEVGKLLTKVAAGQIISEEDCGVQNGIDLDIEDDSLKGRVLMNPVGPVKAGTPIDSSVLKQLKKSKVKDVLVRSPLTCQSENGMCTKCYGTVRGDFLDIGENVGVTAGTSIGEPLAQGSLSAKHSSGMSQGGRKTFSGFGVISQIIQSPKNFPNKAATADLDGTVTKIVDAPQGGHYVFVDDKPHYVLPEMIDFVKVGDEVERGDILSDGVVDVADMIEKRGIGEGRRFYSEYFKKVLDDSGLDTGKRHTETIARAAINHVEIDQGDENYLPGDVISYNSYERDYLPTKEAKRYNTKGTDLLGQHLEQPVLHYSIGTRVTPKVLKRIQKNGFKEIMASKFEPDFTPQMVRLRTAANNSKSWLHRMSTNYIKGNISDSAARGLETNTVSSENYTDTLARGVDFAKDIETTGKF